MRAVEGRGGRWLLCEHSPADVHNCLPAAPAADGDSPELVAPGRSRWPTEQQYRELKRDVGLDHCENHTQRGWMRHVVLTGGAVTFRQIQRARGRTAEAPRPTLSVVRGWVREIVGLPYVIDSRRPPGMLDSFRRNAPPGR